MLIDKGGINRIYIDVYDIDKDNEIGVEVGEDSGSRLVYLTIKEVKQVIEHLQKQIQNKIVDTGAGFQGENQGDGLSGFRG